MRTSVECTIPYFIPDAVIYYKLYFLAFRNHLILSGVFEDGIPLKEVLDSVENIAHVITINEYFFTISPRLQFSVFLCICSRNENNVIYFLVCINCIRHQALV